MTHIKATFQVDRSNRGRRQLADAKPKRPERKARVPHITKLMALAIRLEHLLATDQVSGQAEIARAAGITRARVTQILNLTNLAPDIQEAILDLEPIADRVPRFREVEVRQIAIIPSWEKQRKAWKQLVRTR